MALDHKDYADARVIAPAGRLDHDNCDAFRSELAPHLEACVRDGRALVFDLSRLEYVSSAGLRCFMIAARELGARRRRRPAVAALQPVVAEIFQISRFNLLFDVFATVREALAARSAQAAQEPDRG